MCAIRQLPGAIILDEVLEVKIEHFTPQIDARGVPNEVKFVEKLRQGVTIGPRISKCQILDPKRCPFGSQNGVEMLKNTSKIQSKFLAVLESRFWSLLEPVWLPKWNFWGYILCQKQTFNKKCEPCDSTALASIIPGSGPSKRYQIR